MKHPSQNKIASSVKRIFLAFLGCYAFVLFCQTDGTWSLSFSDQEETRGNLFTAGIWSVEDSGQSKDLSSAKDEDSEEPDDENSAMKDDEAGSEECANGQDCPVHVDFGETAPGDSGTNPGDSSASRENKQGDQTESDGKDGKNNEEENENDGVASGSKEIGDPPEILDITEDEDSGDELAE